VYRSVAGGITLKHVNKVENNIVAGLIESRGSGPQLYGYILFRRGPIQGASVQRNILFHDGGKVPFYDEARIKLWPVAYARDANTDRNLYYYTADPAAAQDFLEAKRKKASTNRASPRIPCSSTGGRETSRSSRARLS